MRYEPTVWETGDVVTAEKMNKLEQGVANSVSENNSSYPEFGASTDTGTLQEVID